MTSEYQQAHSAFVAALGDLGYTRVQLSKKHCPNTAGGRIQDIYLFQLELRVCIYFINSEKWPR